MHVARLLVAVVTRQRADAAHERQAHEQPLTEHRPGRAVGIHEHAQIIQHGMMMNARFHGAFKVYRVRHHGVDDPLKIGEERREQEHRHQRACRNEGGTMAHKTRTQVFRFALAEEPVQGVFFVVDPRPERRQQERHPGAEIRDDAGFLARVHHAE